MTDLEMWVNNLKSHGLAVRADPVTVGYQDKPGTGGKGRFRDFDRPIVGTVLSIEDGPKFRQVRTAGLYSYLEINFDADGKFVEIKTVAGSDYEEGG